MIDCGRCIANNAINTFLRLLVKFLRPSLFAGKFVDFFRKDHNFGLVDTDLTDIEKNRFVLNMSEVDGYYYVAPLSIGWIIPTLDAMGCKDLKVRETLSPPPGDQNCDKY